MKKKYIKELADLGMNINSMTYDYPNEHFLKETGYHNYEGAVNLDMKITFNDPDVVMQFQEAIGMLIAAQQSDNLAVKEHLAQFKTILGVTK